MNTRKRLGKCVSVFMCGCFMAGCFLVWNMSVSATGPISVSDMGELKQQIEEATTDTTIELADDFNTDLETSYVIAYKGDVNITIEGKGKVLKALNNYEHMRINGNSASNGNLTFNNISFQGDTSQSGNVITKGGITFAGGNYIIENVSIEKTKQGFVLQGVNRFYVKNSSFIGNYRDGGSSAIHGEGRVNDLQILNSSFIGNTGAGSGVSSGSIWIKYPVNVFVENSYFEDNVSYATGGGGAIAFTVAGDSTAIRINNSYFKNNKADSTYPGGSSWSDGGAIYYYGGGAGQNTKFSIDSCTFDSNYAHDDGGAVLLEATTPGAYTEIKNSTFVNNHANGKGPQGVQDHSGGAVQISLETVVNFYNNTFYNNKSGGIGSARQDQGGGAIGRHNDSGREATINLYNNIMMDNKVLDTTTGEVIENSPYANISGVHINDYSNIGIDNGTPVDVSITNERVFGTSTPTLQRNFSTLSIGNPNSPYTIDYLPTLPILISGLADNTGTMTSQNEYDARGFKRTSTPDLGAVETSYVKFDANGGSWQNVGTSTYDGTKHFDSSHPTVYYLGTHSEGNIYALDATNLTNNNQQLLGWSSDPTSTTPKYQAGDQIPATNQTLYAFWATPNSTTFTVTFESNGGTLVESITDVEGNTTISAPTNPTKEGYTFAGWYIDDNEFSQIWDFDTDVVTSNMTLYAKWTKDTVTPKPEPEEPHPPIINPEKPVKPTKPGIPTNDGTDIQIWLTIAGAAVIGSYLSVRKKNAKQ